MAKSGFIFDLIFNKKRASSRTDLWNTVVETQGAIKSSWNYESKYQFGSKSIEVLNEQLLYDCWFVSETYKLISKMFHYSLMKTIFFLKINAAKCSWSRGGVNQDSYLGEAPFES